MDGKRLSGGSQDGTVFYLIDEDTQSSDMEDAFKDFPFTVLRIPCSDWNDDLSPWPAPGLGKGADFGGGAETFLSKVLRCINDLERRYGLQPRCRGIAGYSLAGLFALYAVTRTDVFDAAISASGSLWYDGWTDYLKKSPVHARHVYLSLGDREKQTKSKRMCTVEAQSLVTLDILRSRQIDAHFQLNPGNHFKDPEKRLAAGIIWAWERLSEK